MPEKFRLCNCTRAQASQKEWSCFLIKLPNPGPSESPGPHNPVFLWPWWSSRTRTRQCTSPELPFTRLLGVPSTALSRLCPAVPRCSSSLLFMLSHVMKIPCLFLLGIKSRPHLLGKCSTPVLHPSPTVTESSLCLESAFLAQPPCSMDIMLSHKGGLFLSFQLFKPGLR